mmetsp:Transcript_17279/g.22787  ORF Transcript_17279/g.22787 Transcript_17279/m.22787 type:complete len:231 (-) Transcript_17279:2450-3142(-)
MVVLQFAFQLNGSVINASFDHHLLLLQVLPQFTCSHDQGLPRLPIYILCQIEDGIPWPGRLGQFTPRTLSGNPMDIQIASFLFIHHLPTIMFMCNEINICNCQHFPSHMRDFLGREAITMEGDHCILFKRLVFCTNFKGATINKDIVSIQCQINSVKYHISLDKQQVQLWTWDIQKYRLTIRHKHRVSINWRFTVSPSGDCRPPIQIPKINIFGGIIRHYRISLALHMNR